MMPSDPRQPNLDDLFTLKRAERPSQEFWDEFQQEFHVRQRAAAIEPKRWWFVLPRVLVGLSRYQMPMGAAAVLAVTFLSFREYREPGLEVAYAPANPMPAAVRPVAVTPVSVVEDFTPEAAALPEPPSVARASAASARTETPVASSMTKESLPLSPMVVWAGVGDRSESSAQYVSPSARSIAANLAVVRAEQPEIARLPGEPQINLTASRPAAEPLAAIAVSSSSAREPLFAYQPVSAQNGGEDELSEVVDVHSRIARHLSDDQLYESVRRVTAGGDRFTVKF